MEARGCAPARFYSRRAALRIKFPTDLILPTEASSRPQEGSAVVLAVAFSARLIFMLLGGAKRHADCSQPSTHRGNLPAEGMMKRCAEACVRSAVDALPHTRHLQLIHVGQEFIVIARLFQ